LASGEAAKAGERFAAAAKADPKSAAAQAGLGRSLARQHRFEDASVALRRAAELDPGYKEALLELASLYEEDREYDKAIEVYSGFRENVAARERMAVLLIRTGKGAEAGAVLEELLADAPQDAGLRLTYGRVLRDLKKYPAAGEQFARAVQAKPDLAEGWAELAGVLILVENYPAALAALDRLKALGAEASGHLYLRAIILDKTRQLRPALESYEKFLEASQGKSPNEEFLARQRARIIRKELDRR
ncbi:MAG TPA: tetratricopeptide repeat protein, partial [Bryobacteraceae bacterium]|nr:tetratricopeptide repeat protein [Bryobacteraceae bacterium]